MQDIEVAADEEDTMTEQTQEMIILETERRRERNRQEATHDVVELTCTVGLLSLAYEEVITQYSVRLCEIHYEATRERNTQSPTTVHIEHEYERARNHQRPFVH